MKKAFVLAAIILLSSFSFFAVVKSGKGNTSSAGSIQSTMNSQVSRDILGVNYKIAPFQPESNIRRTTSSGCEVLSYADSYSHLFPIPDSVSCLQGYAMRFETGAVGDSLVNAYFYLSNSVIGGPEPGATVILELLGNDSTLVPDPENVIASTTISGDSLYPGGESGYITWPLNILLPPLTTYHLAVRWYSPVPHGIGTQIAADDYLAGEGHLFNRASVFFPGTHGIVDPNCTPAYNGWYNVDSVFAINPDCKIEVERCDAYWQILTDDIIEEQEAARKIPDMVPSCIAPFIPDDDDPIQMICLNFHVFQKTDGTGNHQNTPDVIARFEQCVQWVNGYFSMWNCPTPSDPCPLSEYNVPDTKIRFFLSDVYFYQDDNLWGSSSISDTRNRAFTEHPSASQSLNVYWTDGVFSGGIHSFKITCPSH